MRPKRLLIGSDLILIRHKFRGNNRTKERDEVIKLVGQQAYDLYEHYCYSTIRDLEDFKDESVAEDLGWPIEGVTYAKSLLLNTGLLLIESFAEERPGRFLYRVTVSKRLVGQMLQQTKTKRSK